MLLLCIAFMIYDVIWLAADPDGQRRKSKAPTLVWVLLVHLFRFLRSLTGEGEGGMYVLPYENREPRPKTETVTG